MFQTITHLRETTNSDYIVHLIKTYFLSANKSLFLVNAILLLFYISHSLTVSMRVIIITFLIKIIKICLFSFVFFLISLSFIRIRIYTLISNIFGWIIIRMNGKYFGFSNILQSTLIVWICLRINTKIEFPYAIQLQPNPYHHSSYLDCVKTYKFPQLMNQNESRNPMLTW